MLVIVCDFEELWVKRQCLERGGKFIAFSGVLFFIHIECVLRGMDSVVQLMGLRDECDTHFP